MVLAWFRDDDEEAVSPVRRYSAGGDRGIDLGEQREPVSLGQRLEVGAV